MIRSIIFDMDGTLYPLNGRFSQSLAYQEIKKRMIKFVSRRCNLSEPQAKALIDTIKQKYGSNVSIGLEKEMNIPRAEYFGFVWDLDPAEYVSKDPQLRKKLEQFSERFEICVLSDSPRCWVNKVLGYLNVADIFQDRIFDGEGDRRKSSGNAIPWVLDQLGKPPEQVLMVGDDELLDIIPAKKAGLKTAKIGDGIEADYCVENIHELANILFEQKESDQANRDQANRNKLKGEAQ